MDFSVRAVPGKGLLRFPGLLILLLIAAAASIALEPALGEIFGPVAIVIGQIAAGLVVLDRSRALDNEERRAWRYLAVGMFLVGGGVLAVAAWQLAIGDPPAFGPTDAFFVAGYGLLIATLVSLARTDRDGANWTTTLLDGLVGGVALAALVWTAFFHDLMAGFGGAQWWETLIGLLYPVLDVVVAVAVMVLVIRRSHFHLDLRLVFLGLAMSVQVLADFIYFSSGVGRSFAEAQPMWPLLVLSTTLLLITASLVDRSPTKREFPETGTPMWALLWPYLLAGGLLVTHVVRFQSGTRNGDDTVLLDALLVIVVLIFLRQVYEIRRQRKRVEEQRSELVASVSHELRTPLTAMVGYMTLLDDNADDFPNEAKREMIAEATAQARHMSRLVNDLVMLARGKSRSLPLEISPVRIADVVTAALQDVEAPGTHFETEIDQEAVVNIDPDRMRQVVVNLLSNAVRYGGGRVRLVVRTNNDLEIEVHDDGDGVPTRFQEMIWDRFERGAHRLDASSPGLGIGLSVVRAVAESHGGRASYAQSEVLGGACFSVVIPGAVATKLARQQPVPIPF